MIYWLYISSFAAVWCFYKSYRSYIDREELLKRGKVVDGYISKIEEKEEVDSEGQTYIAKYPFMTYADGNGNEHTYGISTQSDLFKYHLNEEYKLVYDPEGKYEPLVLTRFGIWGDVVGFIVVGVFLIIWVGLSSKGI